MWSEKLATTAIINGYHVLLPGAKKIMADDADKTEEKYISALKLLNLTAENELVLAQEVTV